MYLKNFSSKYYIGRIYLLTNDLFKMGNVNSRKCTFCNLQKETILHLLYECYCVRDLWFQV